MHHRPVHLPRGQLGLCAVSAQWLRALSRFALPGLRTAVHRERHRVLVRMRWTELHGLFVYRQSMGVPLLLSQKNPDQHQCDERARQDCGIFRSGWLRRLANESDHFVPR